MSTIEQSIEVDAPLSTVYAVALLVRPGASPGRGSVRRPAGPGARSRSADSVPATSCSPPARRPRSPTPST